MENLNADIFNQGTATSGNVMSAVINSLPSSSSSLGENSRPELLSKIEGNPARINGVCLFTQEDGVVTISEDRVLRVYLKRETGQYWPSIHHNLVLVPTVLHLDEQSMKIFVGFVNGRVVEYALGDDCNSVTEKRGWSVHTNNVTGLVYASESDVVISCSRDKSVLAHCSATSAKVGSFFCETSCTAMQYDSLSKFVFVGDFGGHVNVLRMMDNSIQLVKRLSAHTGSITSLAWDFSRQMLFSGSSDQLVIMWDLGGKKGQAYELNGHDSKVMSLQYAQEKGRLFSADAAGTLVCWDMMANRIETPDWRSSDICELCDSPFFWNFKAMWDRKVVGLRQHHCRTCGKAVCGSCCNNWTKYPPMGYEKPVRICTVCSQRMKDQPEQFDLTSLASTCDLRQGIVCLDLKEKIGRLVTVTYDRVIMIWDVTRMV
uniref:FYVE-type domain-containing protein n=1 Tax=Steinernema glaseri TaxID=37863 RepID=A0A1I8AAP6_9BILA